MGGQFLANVLAFEHLDGRIENLFQIIWRCFHGCVKPERKADVVFGQACFFHAHDVGNRIRALLGRNGQGAYPTAAHLRQNHGRGSKNHLCVTRNQRLHRRRATFEWNVQHVCSGQAVEQDARQVRRRAIAARAKVEFVRVLFGVGDQLFDVVNRQAAVDGDHHRPVAQQSDGLEIFFNVVVQFFVQRLVDVRVAGNQQGIAIGW